MTTIIIATRNNHKVKEIGTLLGARFNCVCLRQFPDAPEIVEDAPTFSGNAAKKAVGIAEWLCSAHPEHKESLVLADDSGLEVDALDGAPGVHSARFAARDSGRPGNSTDGENNAKLLRLLNNVPVERRTARFRCVVALCPVALLRPGNSILARQGDPESAARIFQGTCEGHIAFTPSGSGGFGYDPLFVPDGYKESFAELGEAVKNMISHRARALAKLKEELETKAG